MDETLVFRKTGAGSAQLTSTHGELPTPARRVLILIDGRRTLAELADLFGQETVEREVHDLEARGFVRQVDPERLQDSPTTIIAGQDAPQSPEAASAPRKAPRVWLALVAIVATLCASAYWIGGREPAASGADPHQAVTGSAFGGPATAAAEVPVPAASSATGSAAAGPAGAATPSPPASATAPASRITPVATSSAPTIALPRMAPPGAAPPPPNSIEAPAPRPTPVNPKAGADAPARLTQAAVPATASVTSPPTADARAPSQAAAVRTATAESQGRVEPASALSGPRPAPAASDAPDRPRDAGPRDASLTLAGTVAPPPAVATVVAPAAATAPATVPEPITTAALQPVPTPEPPVELHARKHDAPQYPPRAIRAGITEGHVEVRLWVSAGGTVEKVDILRANPPRVFDDEVRRTLSQWTFDPPGRAVQKRVDLDFNQ
jgi:protein TonB